MKKYDYKIVEQSKNESDIAFLVRVNDIAHEGYRYVVETVLDSSGRGQVLLEKCLEE